MEFRCTFYEEAFYEIKKFSTVQALQEPKIKTWLDLIRLHFGFTMMIVRNNNSQLLHLLTANC